MTGPADPARTHPRPRLLVAGLGALIIVAFGAVLYGFSVYATDDAAGSEFSTSVLSLALGGSTLVNGLLAPVVGRHADRHGVRWVIMSGSTLIAVGLGVFSFATASWMVVVAWWFLIGPGTAMAYYDPAMVAINQWLPAADHPRAFGMVTVIGGLSATLFIPLTGFLVDRLDWRASVRVLAAVVALVGLTVALTLVPSGSPARSEHIPRAAHRRLLHDRRWVLFTASVVVVQAGLLAVVAHRVDRFAEAGFALIAVTTLAGIASLVSLPGRFAGPLMAARLGGTRVFAATIVVVAVSVGIAAVPATTASMSLHFVVFGVAFGAFTAIRSVVMSGWYPAGEFGRIMGAQSSASLVIGGLGPLAVGVGRDVTGDYGVPFAVLTGVLLVGAALSVAAGASDG